MRIYVARQPIFDRQQKVYAYELLYRSGEDNYNPEINGNLATSEVIANSFLALGLDKLTRRKRAFINFSSQLLNNETALLLPKEYVAIEITEDISSDQDAVAACKDLYKKGYKLVLDDYDRHTGDTDLLNFVEFIKIDYQETEPGQREKIISYFKGSRKKLIAEKVETVQDYGDAMVNGYDFFQGFFFCEPTVITGKEIPGNKLQNLRLLQEIYKPEMDFDQVEALIKQDPSLSYKLLRFINSIAVPVRFPIHSIRQAMALLGQKEIVKWASLVALRNVGYDKPDELIVTAIARGKFCELMAEATDLHDRKADLFLAGLFSLLDTFLDQPMESILNDLPLADEIKSALIGQSGPFRDILQMVLFYEQGQWDKAFSIASEKYNLDEVEVMSYYLESLELADMAGSY